MHFPRLLSFPSKSGLVFYIFLLSILFCGLVDNFHILQVTTHKRMDKRRGQGDRKPLFVAYFYLRDATTIGLSFPWTSMSLGLDLWFLLFILCNVIWFLMLFFTLSFYLLFYFCLVLNTVHSFISFTLFFSCFLVFSL